MKPPCRFYPERAAALDALLLRKTIPELQSELDAGDLTSDGWSPITTASGGTILTS
ncbi:MAG: hypothetical protein U0401_34330 [Anaerolineae bacterium]